MSLVWELDLPPNKRLVLLAYADHADDDGDRVYPSLARIAHKTGYSVDQVRRLSQELVREGLMVLVEQGSGRGRPNRYRLALEKGSKLQPFSPDRKGGNLQGKEGEKGGTAGLKNLAPVPPKPSDIPEPSDREPSSPSGSNEPSGASDEAAPGLEELKKKYKKEAVSQFAERIHDTAAGYSESQKGRFARDAGRFLEKADSTDDLEERMCIVDEVIDRIKERWDDYQLSFAEALKDCQNGRSGATPARAPAAAERAAPSPEFPPSPPEAIEAIRNHEYLCRYAPVAERWDFTSAEEPPFKILARIGGDEEERWRNLERLRSVARRAVREKVA